MLNDYVSTLDNLLPTCSLTSNEEFWFTASHDVAKSLYSLSENKDLCSAKCLFENMTRITGDVAKHYIRSSYGSHLVSRSHFKHDSAAKSSAWILRVLNDSEGSKSLEDVYSKAGSKQNSEKLPTPFAFLKNFSTDVNSYKVITNVSDMTVLNKENAIIVLLHKDNTKENTFYYSPEAWCIVLIIGNSEYIVIEDGVSSIPIDKFTVAACFSFPDENTRGVFHASIIDEDTFNEEYEDLCIPTDFTQLMEQSICRLSECTTLPILVYTNNSRIVGFTDLSDRTHSLSKYSPYTRVLAFNKQIPVIPEIINVENNDKKDLKKICEAVAKRLNALIKKKGGEMLKTKTGVLNDRDIMNVVSNRLYNTKANQLQMDIATSGFFDRDKCKNRVLVIDAPPGSGKTACEVFPVIRNVLNRRDSSVLIATSLQQVSAQIATACSKMIFDDNKYVKVRRVDGGLQMDLKSTLLWSPRCFTDYIFDVDEFINFFIPGNGNTHDRLISFIQNAVEAEFPQSVEAYSERFVRSIANSFARKVIPEALNGFSDTGSSIANVTVGTFEGACSALLNTLLKSNTRKAIEKKLEYIIIDEWDTIFRDAGDNDFFIKKRFTSMYGLIATSLSYMRLNPKCCLILLSASGAPILGNQIAGTPMYGLFDPIRSIGPTQILFNSNPWGSHKIYAIPRSCVKKYTPTVMELIRIVSKYTNINCLFTNDLRTVNATKKIPKGTLSILCIALLLFHGNIHDFIIDLRSCEYTQTLFYMLTQFIAFIRGGSCSSSHMLTIFAQGVDDQVWLLALLGLITYFLIIEGSTLYAADRLRNDINSKSYIEECSNTALGVISKLTNALAIMNRKKDKKNTTSVYNFLSYCSGAIMEKIQKLDKLKMDLGGIMESIEIGLPYFAMLAVCNGIVVINKDMASDALISNFLNSDTAHPVCIITTSKLGEGVDIHTIGPTFVMPTGQSPSPKDTIQWLGRGFRSTCMSCVLPIVEPEIDTNEFWYKSDQELADKHRFSYESFLSSDIAHRIVSCESFNFLTGGANIHSDIDVDFMLPTPLSGLRVSYKSQVFQTNYINGLDVTQNILKNISDTLFTKRIVSTLIMDKGVQLHTLNKIERDAVADAIASNLFGFMQRGWPAMAVALFIPSLQSYCSSTTEDISLAPLVFEIGEKLSGFMDYNTFESYRSLYESRKESVFNQLGMSIPSLFSIDSHQYLFKVCSEWLASGFNAFATVFIIGAAHSSCKTNVYTVPESERQTPPYARCCCCLTNVLHALDTLTTLGFKMSVIPMTKKISDHLTGYNVDVDGPFDVILHQKEYHARKKNGKLSVQLQYKRSNSELMDTFYVLVKTILGNNTSILSNDALILNAIKSFVVTGANTIIEPIASGASIISALQKSKSNAETLATSKCPFVRAMYEVSSALSKSRLFEIQKLERSDKDKVKEIRMELFQNVFY